MSTQSHDHQISTTIETIPGHVGRANSSDNLITNRSANALHLRWHNSYYIIASFSGNSTAN